jgi:hypothetical protein
VANQVKNSNFAGGSVAEKMIISLSQLPLSRFSHPIDHGGIPTALCLQESY